MVKPIRTLFGEEPKPKIVVRECQFVDDDGVCCTRQGTHGLGLPRFAEDAAWCAEHKPADFYTRKG